MKQIKPPRFLVLIGFLLLCYFPLFLHLDSLSLRLWDESRRAVNAFEMLHNGNLLVPHYNGEPDMWGTKPPLMVWLQAGFMSVLGTNELAVRLPSALAGLATVLLLVWFGHRQLRRPALGYFAGLALITMPGYLEKTHSVRSGDYDALLTLWLTGGLLFFFSYCFSGSNVERRRYVWWTTVFIILGVLTKGIAGLFFLPGFLLLAIYKRKINDLLRDRQTYVAMGLFLLVAGGYYLLREQLNPGYLQAVWINELGGRYVDGHEGHHYGFFYYFENLWRTRLPFWILFIPAGIVTGLWQKGKMRDLTLFLSVNALVFLLVISNSKTKLPWYDLPLFPGLAMLAALPSALAYRALERRLRLIRSDRRIGLALVFLLLFFGFPYWSAVETVYDRDDRGHQWTYMQSGNFIKDHPGLRGYAIAKTDYNAHVNFYVKAFNERGYQLDTVNFRGPFVEGQRILACPRVVQDSIWSRNKVEVEMEYRSCQFLRILESLEK